MKIKPTLACILTLALLPGLVLAQGSFTPPGAPAPTMKSLQEIWDRIGGLETVITDQQAQVAALQQRLTDAGLNGVLQETADMVLIPAGPFRMGNCMGSAEGYSAELPVHTVTLSAFWMDKYKVTKARWDEVRTWAANHAYTDLPAGAGPSSRRTILARCPAGSHVSMLVRPATSTELITFPRDSYEADAESPSGRVAVTTRPRASIARELVRGPSSPGTMVVVTRPSASRNRLTSGPRAGTMRER